MENEDFLEYLEYIDLVEEAERTPKRYIRDAENPLEFYEQTVTGDLRGISQATTSCIIRVSVLLAERSGDHINFPYTEQLQRENLVKFHRIAGFPGVAECIDGTHIRIQNPGGDNAEIFRNRKGYLSLNVQVAAGPSMEFIDIKVRHPGSTHYSVIFDRSALRVRIEQRQIHGLLLGDSGYACRPYLLTPVLNPGYMFIILVELKLNT